MPEAVVLPRPFFYLFSFYLVQDPIPTTLRPSPSSHPLSPIRNISTSNSPSAPRQTYPETSLPPEHVKSQPGPSLSKRQRHVTPSPPRTAPSIVERPEYCLGTTSRSRLRPRSISTATFQAERDVANGESVRSIDHGPGEPAVSRSRSVKHIAKRRESTRYMHTNK